MCVDISRGRYIYLYTMASEVSLLFTNLFPAPVAPKPLKEDDSLDDQCAALRVCWLALAQERHDRAVMQYQASKDSIEADLKDFRQAVLSFVREAFTEFQAAVILSKDGRWRYVFRYSRPGEPEPNPYTQFFDPRLIAAHHFVKELGQANKGYRPHVAHFDNEKDDMGLSLRTVEVIVYWGPVGQGEEEHLAALRAPPHPQAQRRGGDGPPPQNGHGLETVAEKQEEIED